MTKYTEKQYWEDSEYIKWDKSIFTKVDAPLSDIRALCDMGLPDWVAPNINFDHYSTESATLKIGEDRDDRDIFIDLKSLKVLVGSRSQFLNSSPYTLRKALQLYAVMVEKAIAIDEDSIVENSVDPSLIQELRDELNQLDPLCLAESSFWSHEIVRLGDI